MTYLKKGIKSIRRKRKKMRLYKHQRELVEKAPKKWLLAHGTGVGKTITAINLVENYGLHNVLVVCPKSLKEQWREQIAMHAKEKLLWEVLTKEEFKNKAHWLPIYKKIIIDEAHLGFGNYKSQLATEMLCYISRVDPGQIYLLTATPYTSSVWSIYSYGLLLGKCTKKDWYKWKRKFFDDIRMGRRTIPIQKKQINGVPMEKIVSQLVDSLGNTVNLSDCRDVPEQIFQTEYFELTSEQKNAIENLTDIQPIARYTKIHQICGGTLKGDEYRKDEFYKAEKTGRLLELCGENKKVVVVCRYNNEIEYIEKILNEKKIKTVKITGQVKDRHDQVKIADASDRCIVLANAACSAGYELPSFPIMIFYSHDFSLVNWVQMLGRIQRINAIKKNVYISLLVKGTIDEDVYKCVRRKNDFQIEIYAKTRTGCNA